MAVYDLDQEGTAHWTQTEGNATTLVCIGRYRIKGI